IDIHTHAGRSKEGPALLLQDGVTGWVDAGSAGADNIDQIATVARTGPQVGRALVNIARTGVISPSGELHDMNVANVALAQGAIARHQAAEQRDELASSHSIELHLVPSPAKDTLMKSRTDLPHPGRLEQPRTVEADSSPC